MAYHIRYHHFLIPIVGIGPSMSIRLVKIHTAILHIVFAVVFLAYGLETLWQLLYLHDNPSERTKWSEDKKILTSDVRKSLSMAMLDGSYMRSFAPFPIPDERQWTGIGICQRRSQFRDVTNFVLNFVNRVAL